SEKLYVRKVGLVAFLNDKKDFPIESWGINDMVAGKVRSALSRRYDVRPLTYRKSAFASLESGQSTLAERIRAEVLPQGLDAYLVVVSGDAQYLGSNQQLHSLGIVEGFGVWFLYALYGITAVDGHDWNFRGHTRAALPGHPKYTDDIKGPYR